uniref:Sortilin_C domain-containing protein n=1 Tax=Parastrongyloides trichosuri TaxID=131310 RepID=A0A0N4ZDH4_PARTI
MADEKNRRLSIPLNILKSTNGKTKVVTNQGHTDFRRVSEDINIPHHINNNNVQISIPPSEMELRGYYPFTPNIVPLDDRIIKFGYASLLENVLCETISESNEQYSNNKYAPKANCDMLFGTTGDSVNMLDNLDNNNQLYLLRKDNYKLAQFRSKCLSLEDTSQLWNLLPEDVQMEIFLTIEKRDLISSNNCEYIWIEDCYANTIKILSMSNLLEVSTNKKKSVRWRNSSNGNIIVHRYSIPYISPKYNLIFMNTIRNNKKCCLMSVWLFMIFVISVAIVVTIILDSKQPIAFTRNNYTSFMMQG